MFGDAECSLKKKEEEEGKKPTPKTKNADKTGKGCIHKTPLAQLQTISTKRAVT